MKANVLSALVLTCLALATVAHAKNKDNKNGTIADDTHGIVWLKKANCLSWESWQYAKDTAGRLQSGMCGLSDSSTAGQWRLPTAKELASRAVDTSGFTNLRPGKYWTSDSANEESAYILYIPSGYLDYYHKGNGNGYIWPVRNK